MNWDEAKAVVEEARRNVNRGDAIIADVIDLAIGRLRVAKISGWKLAMLKRELKNFNMQTEKWMD